jgi:hypothetical protein
MKTAQEKAMIRAARRVATRAGMAPETVRVLTVRACTVNGCEPSFSGWKITNRQRRIFAACEAGVVRAMRRAWVAAGGKAAFFGCPFEGVAAK